MNRISLVLVGLLGCACSDAGETAGNPTGGAGAAGAGGSAAGAGGAAGQVGSGGHGGSSTVGGSAGTAGAASGGAPGGTGGVAGAGGGVTGPDVAFCTTALDAAVTQFTGFRDTYTNPASIPRSAKNGNVNFVGAGDWTSGFVAGSLWYVFEYTQDDAWRTAAEAFTAALEGEKDSTDDHDLGFQFMSSFGHGYRLTNNAAYPDVIETAADSLVTRFSETVGAIRSWNSHDYPVIVDNMMNLKLLYYVAETAGDQAYADVATSHAETTLANHFREDHSAFHLVNYDPGTGAVIGKLNVQGLADGSSWARGQSWGLYGFTEVHGLTSRADFLAQAENAANYLMAHANMPEDKVPYWDYSAPDDEGAALERDASAAAIMASALLELSGYAAEPAATTYRDFALEMLQSLSSPAYAAATGTNSHFLLMHSSTGPVPGNAEFDDAINYADYYYLEALLRCRALGGT